jgi:hypothetical protein
MNWDNFKKEIKPYINSVYNKRNPNETIISWNGWLVMKYSSVAEKELFLIKVKRPTVLNSMGKPIGLVWPLKSKLK